MCRLLPATSRYIDIVPLPPHTAALALRHYLPTSTCSLSLLSLSLSLDVCVHSQFEWPDVSCSSSHNKTFGSVVRRRSAVCLAQNDSTLNKVIQKCENVLKARQSMRAQAIGAKRTRERGKISKKLSTFGIDIFLRAAGHLPQRYTYYFSFISLLLLCLVALLIAQHCQSSAVTATE